MKNRFCTECGALLNEQPGFSELNTTWICTACFHTNDLPKGGAPSPEEGEIPPSPPAEAPAAPPPPPPPEYDKPAKTAYTGPELPVEDDDEKDYSHLCGVGEKKKLTKEERKEHRLETLRKIKKALKITGITVLALFIALIVFEITRLEPLGIDSEAVIGKQYKEVAADLGSRGFNRIETVEEQVLGGDESAEDGAISGIELKLKKSFTEKSKYPTNFKIIITYKTVKKITPPGDAGSFKKLYYVDVVRTFKEAGFTVVNVKPVYDVTLGWFRKDGEVIDVTVGGQSKFKSSSEFRPDAEVVVSYHAYKEK